MFEHLAHFNHILVTGPQRSGTTVCAAMIAHDTGHEFLPEERVPGVTALRARLKSGSRFVLQCPQFCRHIHEFGGIDTFVVMMRRKREDIIASEERINWQGYRKMELARYGLEEGTISDVKYAYWDTFQKHQLHNWMEVEYESLAEHPLWVSKERRANFGARQVSIGHLSVLDSA